MESSQEYRIHYYRNQRGELPVYAYIIGLSLKERIKIFAYIELLKENRGYLQEPYAKHITGKIRELRVDLGRNRHRVFYFTASERRIILLHSFQKKTAKTPRQEIEQALKHYQDFLITKHTYL